MITNILTREDLIPVEEKLEQLAQMYTALMRDKDWTVYTNKTAAILLGVSKRTLQNWRNEGVIPFTQIGSIVYYTREAIQQMLNENQKQAFAKKAKRHSHGK
ncbi:hypothetical protein GCM10027592_31870 [Spirosoma flavus]